MRKLSVCVLFGGISPEHEVSLRSAESVLNNIDHTKYHVFPVGITKGGDWIYFTSRDYSLLPSGQWEQNPANRRAAISPVRGQGLLTFEGDCVVRERIDVVFPVLHGANGEDGAMQGLCAGSASLWEPRGPPLPLPWTKPDQVGGRSGRRPAGRLALGVGR
ncbi:MAG: hypothetical protein ACLU9S_08405 [Oscillospiraceae bacterium]